MGLVRASAGDLGPVGTGRLTKFQIVTLVEKMSGDWAVKRLLTKNCQTGGENIMNAADKHRPRIP